MYSKLITNLSKFTSKFPSTLNNLTLSEKILYSHLNSIPSQLPTKSHSYLKLSPDRIAMQDASAQMALLQFMLSKKHTTAVPTSIHCDHLIPAFKGAENDVSDSIITNKEIFDFLETAALKYGISFWRPGSGIIHQIVLENYAFPGGLMIGTDSHTPNAGGLGMAAIGVGGADAVDVMAGIPWELKCPEILGIRLSGELNGWASPKDVILKLAGQLTVQGGTNHIIEYFGPGINSLSCTGMATICNMGAEMGATTSVFPFTPAMAKYLSITNRSHIADAALKAADMGFLCADKNAKYSKVIEINLSEVEPHINGPYTPDASIPLSKFKERIIEKGWKDEIKVGLIGSCTNSSYEDMSKASSIASQAQTKGISVKSGFLITPGSEQIRATLERDGHLQILSAAGGQILANACGPCIGQWKRTDISNEESMNETAIVSSFNRNFAGRNDGNQKTMNFLASPEIVTAMAFSGKLSFDPSRDSLKDKDGNEFKFTVPKAQDLPLNGFDSGRKIYQPLECTPDSNVEITIQSNSKRLQILEPFEPWNQQEFKNLKTLIKVQGKCTTDHISAAGSWLKYKGHLDNLSNNTLIGARNAFNGKINVVTNEISAKEGSIPDVARDYKRHDVPWAIIADFNYGEGSAREHAALQPRYLGCKMIISRSFARIHETNLKKQGVLPATFKDPLQYDEITEGSLIDTIGLVDLSPNSSLSIRVTSKDGKSKIIDLNHTMSADQIEYFKAGSALNMIAASGNNH